MSDLTELIKAAKQKREQSPTRELIPITVRITPELQSFTDELAEYLGLSRQEMLIQLIKEGIKNAKQTLTEEEKVDEAEAPQQQSNATRFYLLNTNKSNDLNDHETMLREGVAAAFYGDWKFKIDDLKQGDIVFLYGNAEGIVAYGQASGKTIARDHKNEKNECHYQKLDGFTRLEQAISAANIKKILGYNIPFLNTMRRIPDGQKIMDAISAKK